MYEMEGHESFAIFFSAVDADVHLCVYRFVAYYIIHDKHEHQCDIAYPY